MNSIDKISISINRNFFLRLGFLEIGVHDTNSKEEGLIRAFIAAKDFDHPIDHLGTKTSRNLVIF